MSLEEVDDLCLLAGGVKFRDDRKWKLRHATLRRLSPVANTLHLQLFKDGPKGLQSKASLSLDNFRAMETGFTLDRESNTLALLCDGSAIVLAFDAREALIQWQVKVAASVPYVQQFAAQLLVAPPRRLSAGPARLHVQDLRLSLVMGTPPRLAATWPIADLRRYGPADGKYVLEGGARCGRGEGLHVLGVSAGQAQLLHVAVEEAAQCRLQSRRKLVKRQDESPRGVSRHAVSRSCSRDSTLTRSRDGVSYRDSGLCRQASLQWSTWSSDDCDLEYEPIDGSRANGDGQSEVSVSSSGSDSAPRRLRPSVSGQSLRSPRPSRRCGSDCACAIKATRSSLRRTGVLDAGPEAAPQSPVSLPVFVGCVGRFADHVYEEPGERPHSSTGASPPTVVRTVADVHGADPTAVAAAYDRPRPGARRLSPDGVSLGADHLYEDPGPADGWYQTPRACACRRAEPLYKQPACGCVACGGRKPAVGATAPRATAAAAPAAAAAISTAEPTSATMADRPRVDGSGRMPVLNANTGELELPPQPASDVTLCPRIPSEVILGQGLYSRPERPAYAVIDRNRRTLLPGLAPPPARQPAPEHQYANTGPQCGDVMANQYVNMTPATAVTSSGDRANQYVNVSPATAVASTGDRASQYVNVMPATVVSSGADQGGAYVNMAPSSVVTSSGDRANQYVNIAPGAAPTSNCDTTHLYTSMAPSMPCSGQPTYQNMRPPAVDGSTYVNTPAAAAARPPSGAGGEYLEMCRRGRFGALRRSRSMDGGRRRALRSLSLGRKPMPSPKPERVRHLVACALQVAPPTVQVAPPTVRCCSTLPGPRTSTMSSDSGVMSCDSMTSSICGDVARLSCSSSEAAPDGRQTPLSAPSESCSSPRGTGSALKPRSGAQYQCVDRSRLLAQMGEPEAAGRTVTGADST